jgi:argininosuccinate lyase
MALWGGRFEEKFDKKAYDFNESLSVDKMLWKEDIIGSMAHASMLGAQNIISKDSAGNIVKGLEQIYKKIENGELVIKDAEDIHSFIENELIKIIGDDGKKLHTARSRNDQVATDTKLYCIKKVDNGINLLTKLIDALKKLAVENENTIMPGFTHLQKAQPITLALYFDAYKQMFKRDLSRFNDLRKRMDECPLGACALAGTIYDIDRDFVSEKLGFAKPTDNALDSVSDRDYLIEFLSALSIVMMHISRMSEEFIIWNSDEYRYIKISDKYTTGSSIMPQKKNPDICELMRGKTAQVFGSLLSMLALMKALPLAYNKDMQEDKAISLPSINTALDSIEILKDLLLNIEFDKEKLKNSCLTGFINATDVADYLVNKDTPFRDAHEMVGKLVLYAEKNKKTLNDLTLEEFRGICGGKIQDDIYDKISLETIAKARKSKGSAFGIDYKN